MNYTGERFVVALGGVQLVPGLFQLSSDVDEILCGRLCVVLDAV